MKKWWIITLFIGFFIVSCSQKKDLKSPRYDININKYIEEFCSADNKDGLENLQKMKFKNINLVVSFYKNRNFQSVWVKEQKATPIFHQAIGLLKESMGYGLDTTMYATQFITNASNHISKKEFGVISNMNVISMEIATTHSLITFLGHLKSGIFMPDSAIYDKMVVVNNDSMPIFLEHAIQRNDLSLAVDAVSPKNPHYKEIQQALSEYLKQNDVSDTKYSVPFFAKDSTGCKNGVRKMLVVHGYLKDEDLKKSEDDKEVVNALVKFQTDFGLRNRGRYDTITIETIRNSKFDMYRKACITLQRIRWSNINDKNYLLVNIPSFTLNLVEDGEIAITHRIVCGKPDHETPELNSRISHFILFPEWNVPHKISTKELLPSIQANPNYLKKHNYEIINGKNEVVDASKINWKRFSEKNFPYRIRQSSGEGNSLGIIKFYFNNKYGVYLHDTPSKTLFNLNYRAFSHGCMRVQNPFDFAKALLEFKKGILHHPVEKLKKMGKYEQQRKYEKYRKGTDELPEVKTMNKDVIDVKNSTFTMTRPLPLYVRYFTAFVNEKSRLKFLPDLYHKDEPLIKAFNKATKENRVL